VLRRAYLTEADPETVADVRDLITAVAHKGYDTNANHQQLRDNGQRRSIIVKKNRANMEILGQANTDSQRERCNIEHKFAEQSPTRKSAMATARSIASISLQQK